MTPAQWYGIEAPRPRPKMRWRRALPLILVLSGMLWAILIWGFLMVLP